jgi:hypothetical protein
MDVSEMIESEDDLVVYLGKLIKSDTKEVFPKVDILSRNIDISPDIDLLVIDNENKCTIGYETKLVQYVTNWNRYNYNPFYSGIGEALLYFQYGIDKVYLAIGIEYKNEILNEHKNKIDGKIRDVVDLLEFSNLKKFLGFNIYKICDDKIITSEEVPIRSGLITHPQNYDENRKTILKKEFHYEQKTYNKIYGD